MRDAVELRKRAKNAAKKATKGNAKDRQHAAALAAEAAKATHAANREYFLLAARIHMECARAAIDKIVLLCERRKYRVLTEDLETILKPLKYITIDLEDAMTIAAKRKSVWPSELQIQSDPADNFGAMRPGGSDVLTDAHH